jgi:hypothetical protein
MATPDTEDVFSDIDLRWTIPAEQAAGQLRSLRATLQRIGTVESLRVDPVVRPDVRLVFVRIQGWPLWWRVDLEVHSAGSGSMGVRDADAWSPYESACMGVVVTLKALARNRPDAAEDLLAGALQRLEATDVAGDWQVPHRLAARPHRGGQPTHRRAGLPDPAAVPGRAQPGGRAVKAAGRCSR